MLSILKGPDWFLLFSPSLPFPGTPAFNLHFIPLDNHGAPVYSGASPPVVGVNLVAHFVYVNPFC